MLQVTTSFASLVGVVSYSSSKVQSAYTTASADYAAPRLKIVNTNCEEQRFLIQNRKHNERFVIYFSFLGISTDSTSYYLNTLFSF